MPSWSQFDRTRDRLRQVRDDGRLRLWTLRTNALTRAHDLFDRADDWPAVGRLASVAGRAVDRQLDRLTSVPVAGWDELNARRAVEAVGTLDRMGLVAARRRESSTKNRKTVLRAIDVRLGLPAADGVPGDAVTA